MISLYCTSIELRETFLSFRFSLQLVNVLLSPCLFKNLLGFSEAVNFWSSGAGQKKRKRGVNCALWCHSWAKWIHVDGVHSSVWAKKVREKVQRGAVKSCAVLHRPSHRPVRGWGPPGEPPLGGNMWDSFRLRPLPRWVSPPCFPPRVVFVRGRGWLVVSRNRALGLETSPPQRRPKDSSVYKSVAVCPSLDRGGRRADRLCDYKGQAFRTFSNGFGSLRRWEGPKTTTHLSVECVCGFNHGATGVLRKCRILIHF